MHQSEAQSTTDLEFELSDDSSDENGENEDKNMNEYMRKRIRTRGGTNAVLRRGYIKCVQEEDVLITR